ncbi:MAG: UDP-N-acetylglucosamine 2-epimerase, partial [Culturomica sp.]|nr:UDP-N-acetylglucosamine 2-epimerase [Culturomica sp.]
MMKKICVITGSRAEYGLMSRLMRLIEEDADLQLQIIATNMHLSMEHGETYKEIEADGFTIDKKIPILSSSDTVNATVQSVGTGIIGFAHAYEELRPDMIMVLGDRYEILAAVSAALFYKIPVIHLHGGEITEGAFDDAIRHAIT